VADRRDYRIDLHPSQTDELFDHEHVARADASRWLSLPSSLALGARARSRASVDATMGDCNAIANGAGNLTARGM